MALEATDQKQSQKRPSLVGQIQQSINGVRKEQTALAEI
jgi:hypothetical protein